MREDKLIYQIDWITILIYLILVFSGWLNIYAADFDPDIDMSILNITYDSGKQLIWIGTALLMIVIIMVMDFRFYESFSYPIYGLFIALLVFVLLFGREVAGSKSWFEIGAFRLQPSELTKFATALALSNFLGNGIRKSENLKTQVIGFLLFLIPAGLIILQGDTGTALVFAGFVLVMFREGMHPMILILGLAIMCLFFATLLVSNKLILIIVLFAIAMLLIGWLGRSSKQVITVVVALAISISFVFSVDFILTDVLKPHQQKRVMSLINPNADPLGVGWNVTQSKIAIGSGGLTGKGFLEGTQTKFDFVPAQTTDFIFCTIGEEHGWLGSFMLVATFTFLFLRLLYLAERQKTPFARIYGYCVTSILFFHFAVNIAMTIGLFPVIGIPLPFFSYGGSSLWSFTILLFTFLKLDAHRMQILQRW